MLDVSLSKKDIESIVYESIQQILDQKSLLIQPIKKSHKLNADLSFTSLDLAQLITGLEIRLDSDPFSELISITSIRTVDDLCHAYYSCSLTNTDSPSDSLNSDLKESQDRANERRQAIGSNRRRIINE